LIGRRTIKSVGAQRAGDGTELADMSGMRLSQSRDEGGTTRGFRIRAHAALLVWATFLLVAASLAR
jgi:hypothetical protein